MTTLSLPRRQKAPAKTGPRLDLAPWEIRQHLTRPHGLSALLTEAPEWDRFVWNGHELSSPMKALYTAEAMGLLTGAEVAIADVTAEINDYRAEIGREPVAALAVASNLRIASLYLQAALGVSIHPSVGRMTVQLIDNFDSPDAMKQFIARLGRQYRDLLQRQRDLERAVAEGLA